MFSHIFSYLYNLAVVLLVNQIVAYLVVCCLYIWNSSGWQEKIISTGFLVLILVFFLVPWIGIDALCGANIAAISAYCIWKVYPAVHSWLCSTPKIVRAILHGAIVAFLLAFLLIGYFVCPLIELSIIIQLAAYTAIGCLYIFSSSNRKEQILSAGFLVLVKFGVLLCSFTITIPYDDIRVHLVFWANIVVISSYCIWKLYTAALAPMTSLWLPEQQQERRLLLAQTPFRIQELPREFSSDEIRAMTQDFRIMVGQGGFAQVFRGSFDDGTAVAVKRININIMTSEGPVTGDDDFLREVSIVANVHHRSLVRLLGYCLPRGGGSRYLVYPFLENGSLDRWLFHGGEERRRLLTWPTRRCIAIDVARALAYLHHECHRRILHLDVKPGNILLDGALRAHVSDFGISVSVARDLTSVVDTRGRGTLGYMAPEMLVNAVSDKSDVYSYGMTLLELVSGRRNFEEASPAVTPDLAREFFPCVVREKMARGELMEAVDAAMADVDEAAVEMAVRVALCCIQRRRDLRPSMLAVVDMLEGRFDADLPPESRPPSAVDFPEPLHSRTAGDSQ